MKERVAAETKCDLALLSVRVTILKIVGFLINVLNVVQI